MIRFASLSARFRQSRPAKQPYGPEAREPRLRLLEILAATSVAEFGATAIDWKELERLCSERGAGASQPSPDDDR